ncbi:probable protein phosphatase 2C 35 [Zingiber officinale]|uniref:protein-serine/threonine phosphatase n=1 Tax=Zingiber officinale TaxID=94328 RepID=A0A8J5G0B2_ZINOF|nr:probable protein phosphatase 2C 35 [Zingiber officinale]KAG6493722.1 hypothetical protein ZIOFF_048722 [Zingiber officinale]
MGCVQGTNRGRCRCLNCRYCCWCCCHYHPPSISTDGAVEGPDPLRVHEIGSPRCLLRAFSNRAGPGGTVPVPSAGVCLRFASLTQRGHYPDSLDRVNQDSFCVRTSFQANPDLHFFGVFDGHGQFGAQCAEFVRDMLTDLLNSDSRLPDDPVMAFLSAFVATNSALHDSEIDDSMSGTTAITVLVSGDTLYVANVGDSRAVAGVWSEGRVVAQELSIDQTPYRKDEYQRVKQCGARVLCVDQVEGMMDPDIQSWGDEEDGNGDPPRLWVQNGMYPGTAFTRSIGDMTAESIGVIAVPEVKTVKITPNHLFFVIASDGIFEFLSSHMVVDMVSRFPDPRDACSAITAESYKLWLGHENRTDDITVIIVHIKDMEDSTYQSDSLATLKTIQTCNNASISSETVKFERQTISEPSNNVKSSSDSNSCSLGSAVNACPERTVTSPTTRSVDLNVINPD